MNVVIKIENFFSILFNNIDSFFLKEFNINLYSFFCNANELYNSLFEINNFVVDNCYELSVYINHCLAATENVWIFEYKLLVKLVIVFTTIFNIIVFFLYSFLILDKLFYGGNFFFYFWRARTEIENNLSNYLDLNRLFILFVFFLNFFISLYIKIKFSIFLSSFLALFLILNLFSILYYFYAYNVNIFVFIKGTIDKIKIYLVDIFDIVSSVTFVSRLLLQFLRLIICILIFINFHILGVEIVAAYYDWKIMSGTEKNYGLLKNNIKVVIEYLDMILNFMAQYSIYIIAVMWLIPYLFSFIKKFLKIKNK